VIDALAVRKDADGNVSVLKGTQLSDEEMAEFGATVGALVGLGAEAALERGGVFTDEEAWDVLAEIPDDAAAALILLEHRWATPLRDAIASAGGFRLAAEFISPLDLVEIGLVTAEEAKALEAADS
jgi:hypothetical protein